MEIRRTIELALEHEQKFQHLERYLYGAVQNIHKAVHLPQRQPLQALHQFISQYIGQVPDVLDGLAYLLNESQTHAHFKSIINIAEDFFADSTQANNLDLVTMMHKAYLAHRLFEELNDQVMLISGKSLLPFDITTPNLVIHTLLGDQFANQIDLAAQIVVGKLFQQPPLRSEQAERLTTRSLNHIWIKLFMRWPNLSEEGNVYIRFTESVV